MQYPEDYGLFTSDFYPSTDMHHSDDTDEVWMCQNMKDNIPSLHTKGFIIYHKGDADSLICQSYVWQYLIIFLAYKASLYTIKRISWFDRSIYIYIYIYIAYIIAR